VLLAVVLPAGWQLLAAAVSHAWLLIRWNSWLTARRETAADRWAAQRLGTEQYARALAAYLRDFEATGSRALRRQRLRGLKLSSERTEALIDESETLLVQPVC
jgi:hypothetical protein